MTAERAATLLLATGLLLSTAPAGAAVRSTYVSGPLAPQGTLRAESDAGDPIVIACIGGMVEVNGAPPDTGPLGCGQANRIEVVGGPGGNRIDLGGIAPAQRGGIFRGVAASATIEGGAGDDIIIGPSAGLVTVIGGAGSDWLQGQGTAIDKYVFGPALATEQDTLVEPVSSQCNPSYFDSDQPGLSYWTVPWDALDFSALPAGDPVSVDERVPAGILASHRNRTVKSPRTSVGVAIEAVSGGAGDDRIVAGCMAVGGLGADALEGTSFGGGLLLGGPGDDRLTGRTGPDRLDGGPGADELEGGAAADGLVGAAGNDVLRGGSDGDTYLFGSADGAQTDTVEEARAGGVDVLSFDLAADAPVTVELSARSGLVARARGLEVRTPPGGGSLFEGVIGGKGNDRLTGHGRRNHFWSGGGVDLVAGRGGNDTYYVDWTASMPYWAYRWGEVWSGPFERTGSQAGRVPGLARETRRSVLRISEGPKGGVDTIEFADQWLTHSHGGARLEGQVTSGIRLDLTAPLWIANSKRVGAVTARRNGGRYLEGLRGTTFRDVLIGNAASNVLEGRHGSDRVFGGKGKDLCLIETRAAQRDALRSCERVRRVDPDR